MSDGSPKFCVNCAGPVSENIISDLSAGKAVRYCDSKLEELELPVSGKHVENSDFYGFECGENQSVNTVTAERQDVRTENGEKQFSSTENVENPSESTENGGKQFASTENVENPSETESTENGGKQFASTENEENPSESTENGGKQFASTENGENQSLSNENKECDATTKFSSDEIANALQSIYSLNFLHFFDDDPIFESAPILCSQCEHVLVSLHRCYEEFNHLRKTESHLAQKIKRLTQIIDSQRQSIIKCEVLTEEDNDGEVHLPDIFPCESDDGETGDEKDGNLPIQSQTGSKNKCAPGPWVVLERLKLPEGQSSVQTRKVIKGNDPIDLYEDNYDDIVTLESSSSEWSNNSNADDSDYGVPKKKTKTAKKGSRMSSRLLRKRSTPTVKPENVASRQTSLQPKSTSRTKVSTKSKKVVKSDPKKTNSTEKSNVRTQKKRGKLNKKSNLKSQSKSKTGSSRRRTILQVDKHYRKRKCKHAHPCWHCKMNFDDNNECREHATAEHLRPGYLICEDCSRVCKTPSGMDQHKQQCAQYKPGEKLPPLECPICHKCFTWKSYFKHHVKLHGDERPYPCSKCNYRAKSRELIRMHEKRMHDESAKNKQPLQCGQCESFFKNEQGLKIHMYYQHTEEGNRKYRETQRAMLEKQKEKRKANRQNKSYVCTECNVDFFTNLRLLCHQKAFHQIQKNFVCEQCGKDFSRNHSLQHHIVHVHSDARPFMCEHCGKAFKTNYNLKDHVDHTHSEEGRRKYNEKMRIHHQRRRMVAEALARKQEAQKRGLPLSVPQTVLNDPSVLPAPHSSTAPPPPVIPHLEPSHWQAAAAAAGLSLPLPLLNPTGDGLLNLASLPQFPTLPSMEFDAGSSESSV